MADQMSYDIIVVGASPAGLMAAWKASQAGSSVLLLDKKERIGDGPHPADTTFEGMFKITGLSIQKEYVIHGLRGMHIVSPSGFRIVINSPGFAIDRAMFDEYYAGIARDSGAEIKTGSRAIDLTLGDETQEVTTRENNEKRAYKAKIVIGADGIESSIPHWAGLKSMKHPEEMASAVQAEMIGVETEYPDYFQYHIGRSVAPGWKATISPKGDSKASVAAFVRNAPRPAMEYFNQFVYKNKLASHFFEKAKILDLLEGGDPIATMPGDLVDKGIMIVGGAGGQAGLPYGMLAGIIGGDVAAKAIAADDISKKRLEGYVGRWRKELFPEYKTGYRALKVMERIPDEDVDKMVKALRDVDVTRELSRHSTTFMKGLGILSLALRKDPKLLRLVKYLV
ncbi:MAG: NAD(P)/FAD-dependent oxidoreductase [Methanocellales archaeon]|nr:NAD(P)/FAD-dependent oxidoreductase [Methanocellales archaeon]MDD3291953.1 NAD(P)/FAD-dependent oxidoreductase [Methanocellales archaeon]MDD5235646.1 NAD(P)/FAD-dependent oxidoreductase [Methanocellales archaeon]MDD5485493.1 NAD(P)/FAD-dependent oxidoreductase [Methanocellales archaeon]